MSLTGKGSLSLRRQDVKEQKSIAVGFKKLVFAHKATLGDTGIDLTSLTAPSSEMPTHVNPSISDLLAANLLFYKNNLMLISTDKGLLMGGLSYEIRSSSRINFKGFTAEDGEIFIGILDPVAKTELTAVDAKAIVASGELAIGSTDFNVGEPFEINKYDTQQVGAVVVFRNGVQQFRNPGNGTSGGNYQELNAGTGLGTVIRFNNAPVGQADSILVISNGLLAERPDGSMMAVIESLAGQLDAIIPTVAELADVPESDFQGAPNNVDLKQFGDRVLASENSISDIRNNFQEEVLGTVSSLINVTTSVGTWAKVTGLSVTIPTSGRWRLAVDLDIDILCAAGHTVRAQFAYSTTLAVGSRIHEFSGGFFHNLNSAPTRVGTLHYISPPLDFTAGQTVYLEGQARAWSGGATITLFDIQGGVDAAYPAKIRAIRVGD